MWGVGSQRCLSSETLPEEAPGVEISGSGTWYGERGGERGRDRLAAAGGKFAIGGDDVLDFDECAVLMAEEEIHIGQGQRSGAAPAEDDGLAAGFIDDAVAIEAAGDCKGGALSWISGDEPGTGRGAESSSAGDGIWRDQLEDSKAVFAIGDKGVHRGVDGADLDGAGVVQLAAGVEYLVNLRVLGILDLNDGEAVWAVCDIGISAGEIESIGAAEFDGGGLDWDGVFGVGNIEDFEAFVISYECVAELDGDGAGIGEPAAGYLTNYAGIEGIAYIDNDEAFRCAYIEAMARGSGKARAIEDAAGVEDLVFF